MIVAYQWMQNDERVLENYISIIFLQVNREINAKNCENASRGDRKIDPSNKHRKCAYLFTLNSLRKIDRNFK